MMRSGGAFSAASAPSIVSGVTLMEIQRLSNRSRMVCTCGRISRPLGASLSWGITSITTSPSFTRRPVMLSAPYPSGSARVNSASSTGIPVRSTALTAKGERESSVRMRSISGAGSCKSLLLTTAITGTPLLLSASSQDFSKEKSVSLNSIMAISALGSVSRVFCMRSSPSAPSSSKPAVSINTQAPNPRTSIAL